jgi:DNA-binding HxlR family transcriptional regulator
MLILAIFFLYILKALIELEKVIDSLGDRKSLSIFKYIAKQPSDTSTLRTQLSLSRKQYYTRLSEMVEVGLVRKYHSNYTLTSFGKMVYDALEIMELGLTNFWKLKALDSLEFAKPARVPHEEKERILESLIDNMKIKEILLTR